MDGHLSQEIFEAIWILVCLFMSSFFSGSETSITAFGQLKAQHLVEQRKGKNSKHLILWMKHPARILSTILLFNNIFNIAASAQATVIATRYFESQAVGIATGITTFLVLVFGEIVPKSFARAHYERTAETCLRVIYVLYVAFYPLVRVLSGLANFVLKTFGSESQTKPSITEDELEFLINEGEKAGVLEDTKKDMLTGVFDFDETKVREVMTPRTDVIAISQEDTIQDAVNIVIQTGHSRLPVYEDRIDNIVGMIFAKDVLRHIHQTSNPVDNLTVASIMREPLFVPESKQLMDVFKDLKRTKNHMAIVIDEYGGTAGIATMEDILEEIVGEIQDEFDAEEDMFLKIEKGVFDVAGSVSISDFMDYFDLEDQFIQEVEGEVETIGGWMTLLLGDLPEVGQTVTQETLTIEVVEVSRHRIEKIRVTQKKPQKAQKRG